MKLISGEPENFLKKYGPEDFLIELRYNYKHWENQLIIEIRVLRDNITKMYFYREYNHNIDSIDILKYIEQDPQIVTCIYNKLGDLFAKEEINLQYREKIFNDFITYYCPTYNPKGINKLAQKYLSIKLGEISNIKIPELDEYDSKKNAKKILEFYNNNSNFFEKKENKELRQILVNMSIRFMISSFLFNNKWQNFLFEIMLKLKDQISKEEEF